MKIINCYHGISTVIAKEFKASALTCTRMILFCKQMDINMVDRTGIGAYSELTRHRLNLQTTLFIQLLNNLCVVTDDHKSNRRLAFAIFTFLCFSWNDTCRNYSQCNNAPDITRRGQNWCIWVADAHTLLAS